MEDFYDFVDEVGEEEVPNIRQQLLDRAYCGTLWLAIVLGVNPFLNTIFFTTSLRRRHY
jgi:hypothetical protein